MSLILDALKKSENERKNVSTPSISDVRAAPAASGTPRWLWVLLGLLVVNLMVLIFVLTRSDSSPAEQTVQTAPVELSPANSAPRQSSVQLPPVAGKEPVRSLAREAASRPTTPQNTATENQSPRATSSESNFTPAPRESTPARNLPTLNALKADSTMNIPELQLDLHVYNDEPSQRLVFINGSKYAEGASLSEGPKILRIRPDGVAMRHRGIDFLLPRE